MMRGDDPWTEADRARVVDEIREWLWLYLGRGQPTGPGALATAARLLDLPQQQVRRLCALHFVLSPEVAAILEHAAPAALRAAGRSVTHSDVRRGVLRGRPDWPATHRQRTAAGGDPSLYVYSSPRRDRRYEGALARLLQDIRAAASTALTGVVATERGTGSWQAACAQRAALAAELLDHPRLARQPPAAGGDEEVPLNAPHPAWWPPAAAARLLHRRLVAEADPQALAEALAARVVEPAGADVLFELWAALAALTALEEAGWQRVALRLLGAAGGGPFAIMRGPASRPRPRLALYVQHTPRSWRMASRYAEVFARYGLAGGMRRPDMIVEVTEGGTRRWLLVEVKRTVDPTYIAESVYKVLGYLADFAPVLQGSPPPHGLLLVWHLAQPAPPPHGGPLVVTSPAGYAVALRAALGAS